MLGLVHKLSHYLGRADGTTGRGGGIGRRWEGRSEDDERSEVRTFGGGDREEIRSSDL